MAHSLELALMLFIALAAGSASTIAGMRVAAHDHSDTDPKSGVANPLTIMAVGMACFFSVAAAVLTVG
jgi:hypothetical protein